MWLSVKNRGVGNHCPLCAVHTKEIRNTKVGTSLWLLLESFFLTTVQIFIQPAVDISWEARNPQPWLLNGPIHTKIWDNIDAWFLLFQAWFKRCIRRMDGKMCRYFISYQFLSSFFREKENIYFLVRSNAYHLLWKHIMLIIIN
jgi:hypothetical protein